MQGRLLKRDNVFKYNKSDHQLEICRWNRQPAAVPGTFAPNIVDLLDLGNPEDDVFGTLVDTFWTEDEYDGGRPDMSDWPLFNCDN